MSKYDNMEWIRQQPDYNRRVLVRRVIQFVEGVPYYIVMILFFLSLWRRRNDILTVKGLFPLLALMGTLGTCILTVEVRFHYPYLFCIVLWAAHYLATRKQQTEASAAK